MGVTSPAVHCLIVPGLSSSGPDHWQSVWERERSDCRRIELGCWDDPSRDIWVAGIDRAVRGADARPIVLVAHSLGCLAVAWWAAAAPADQLAKIRGALLVAPPDVDRERADSRLERFAPTPLVALPFPAIVVGSRNDPYATFPRLREIAEGWAAVFVDAGAAGHINAASGLGNWAAGQHLLDVLIAGEPFRDRGIGGPQQPVSFGDAA